MKELTTDENNRKDKMLFKATLEGYRTVHN